MSDSSIPAPVADLAWTPQAARDLGERVVSLWEQLLESLPSLPVGTRRTYSDVRNAVTRDVPEDPVPVDELMDYLSTLALSESAYPGHPAFMAYISGAGTIPGAAADLLAAALNQNLGGWLLSPGATEIELQVLRWLSRELGLGERSGGILTSGGAMANFTALKCARDRIAGWDVRDRGIRDGGQLVLYASDEAHSVIDQAADMLGIGRDWVRHVPTDEAYRMRVDELVAAIREDRRAGHRPLAVVATAGTTATGSIDPLVDIAGVCQAEGLWMHVDGAYGAAAVLAPQLRPLLAGIERADSVAIDPHKWLYVPLACGCTLVREERTLPESFAAERASYLYEDKEGTGRGTDLGNYGPQFSRGFVALKVWLSLLAHGRAAYARRIQHDADLAQYLDSRVRERPEFESMAPVPLSIACFRYVPPELGRGPHPESVELYLDELNERLLIGMQLDGRTFCSNAVLGKRFVLRACIVNFRTEAEHVDLLLDVAAELGAQLHRGSQPADVGGAL